MNAQKIINALQVLGASAEAAKSTTKRIESATQRTGDSSPSGHLRSLAMSLHKSGTESRTPVTLAGAIVIEALADFARQAETQDRAEAKAKAEKAKADKEAPKPPQATPEALILAELPSPTKKAGTRQKAKPDPVKATRKAEAKIEAEADELLNAEAEAKIARIIAQVLNGELTL